MDLTGPLRCKFVPRTVVIKDRDWKAARRVRNFRINYPESELPFQIVKLI
jgi:hypothetical protein